MGRSQETFNKKEVKNKKEKKRKEKEKKRQMRKETGKSSFDDMIAYVDEYGKLSSTPPDPSKKIQVEATAIELSATKNDSPQKNDFVRKGVVTFFNDSKGFGFIRDMDNNQSVFVHANNLEEKIKENNIVTFEIGKGPKGLTALKVKLFKN
ncbi:MAG: cold shock domain-containing protein [Bacteroidetes bacterium]|nr:MAG: cold shock domain-containing protein [Bacteroidota bacterium]